MSMSLREVMKHFRRVECEENREEGAIRVSIPTLGFLGMYYAEDREFGQMFFLVRRLKRDDADPAAKMGLFTGNISDVISFSKGDVRRGEVVSIFGEPVRIVTRSEDTGVALAKQHDDMWKAWEDNRPFEFRTGSTTAILYYPTNGIAFLIEGDTIEEIRLFRPDARARDTSPASRDARWSSP